MNNGNVFEIQVKPEYTLIRFFGFVDASTVEMLKPALQTRIPPECRNIAIDLQAVDFLDSHGVGLFVSFLKQAHRNQGRLVFSGAEGQPESLLQMVGFNGALVSYCATIDDAIQAFDIKTG